MTAFEAVRARQRAWATGQGYEVDKDDRLVSIEKNVRWFTPRMREAFRKGRGGELVAEDGKPPKICSLYSSVALVCNVFGYWEDNPAPVAAALGFNASPVSLRFEAALPSGLKGTAPTLDLLLEGPQGMTLGVESKFTEPFQGRSKSERPFSVSYFASQPGLWETRGLERCQDAAERIQGGELCFDYLDAPQLLKHVLGLRPRFPSAHLLLLRYDAGTEEDKRFEEEIHRFAGQLDPSLGFRSLTYQEVFQRLSHDQAGEPAYLEYVGTRYFRL